MKLFTRILAFVLLSVMVLSLVACSTYGAILKNFEEAGYTEIKDDDNSSVKTITAELEKGDLTCDVHFLRKEDGILNTRNVIILEFSSEKELLEAVEESETLKGLIKDAQKSEFVNGNCVLLPLLSAILDTSIRDLFNASK
jgi:hypothetical protein